MSIGPGDPRYSIRPPRRQMTEPDLDVIANVVVQICELGAQAHKAQREYASLQMQTDARIEQFKAQMTTLEKQLEADYQSMIADKQAWFAIANRLVEQGKDQAAIQVLDRIASLGHKSMVQSLVDYHQGVTMVDKSAG